MPRSDRFDPDVNLAVAAGDARLGPANGSDEFDRASADAPNVERNCSPQTLFENAWQSELAGQDDAAAALYRAAIAHVADPHLIVEAEFRLAWLALRAGQHSVAIPHLARAMAVGRDHAMTGTTLSHARYWHAVCVEHDQRFLEAAALYRPVIEEGDARLWHEAAYRRLACLVQVGDLAAAVEAADHLLECDLPVHDATRLTALRLLARDERTRIERAQAAA